MNQEYQPIKGLGTGRGGNMLTEIPLFLILGVLSFFFVRSRLYAHEDHLLVMQSSGLSENYKRLFYRDIRYVVMRKTYGQEIQAMISGAFVLGTLALALTPMPWWIPLLLCVPFMTWFVMNWIWGSAGKCYANTAIQTIELPTPRRMDRLPVLVEFLNSKIPTS